MQQLPQQKSRPRLFWQLLLLAFFAAACSNKDTTEPPAPLTEIQAEKIFKRQWRIDTGSGAGGAYIFLQPYITADFIFIADRKGRLQAIERATGKTHWQSKTGFKLSSGVTGDDEILIVAAEDNILLAFEQQNGTLLWQAGLSSRMLSVPAIDLGIVVTRTLDGNIQAFAKTTGNKLWSYQHIVPPLSLHGTSSPIIYAGGVIVGADNGRFAALSANDGRLLWETSVAVPSGHSELTRLVDIDIPAITDQGIIFIAAYQGRVVAMSMQGGQTIWARDRSIAKPMALDADKLYAVAADSHVWSFDRVTGETVWMQDKLHARPVSGLAVLNDVVLIGDFDGYLHALHITDGRLVARTRVSRAAIVTPPLVVDGIVYVLAQDGTLAALTLEPLVD